MSADEETELPGQTPISQDDEGRVRTQGVSREEIEEQLRSVPTIQAQYINEGGDLGALDPETLDLVNFHYRFVHESPAKITKRLRAQWVFVRRSVDGVRKLYEPDQGPDDFIRDGDRVLMKITRPVHEAYRARIEAATQSRLAAPKGQFRKKARQSGVEVTSKRHVAEPI